MHNTSFRKCPRALFACLAAMPPISTDVPSAIRQGIVVEVAQERSDSLRPRIIAYSVTAVVILQLSTCALAAVCLAIAEETVDCPLRSRPLKFESRAPRPFFVHFARATTTPHLSMFAASAKILVTEDETAPCRLGPSQSQLPIGRVSSARARATPPRTTCAQCARGPATEAETAPSLRRRASRDERCSSST